MTTLDRLLEAVFIGKAFESLHNEIPEQQIAQSLYELPFSLSKSQKNAISRTLQNDITYIQGPPGTGKSFTISALAIAASKIGMKVLIASQKKPAVDIVYEKITSILGKAGCIYISDNPQTKANTREIIDALITKSTDSEAFNEATELNRISIKIDSLIRERQEYARKICLFESDLSEFYRSNEEASEARNILVDDFGLTEESIRNINHLHNKKSSSKADTLIKECIAIREESRQYNGQVSMEKALRLKILSTAILRTLDIKIDDYKRHKEEVLKRAYQYSSKRAKTDALHGSINKQPIDATRKTFERLNTELYPASPEDSILSEYHNTGNSVRINGLLQEKRYKDCLDAFHRRLRWKNSKRAKQANSKIDFNLLLNVFPIVLGEIKSLHPYLPFEEESFDLVILDEASQINLAEVFPILFRAKRYCIVGDHKQLGIKAGGVIFISKVYEKLTWDKHFSGLANIHIDYKSAQERDLVVSRSSILDLIRNHLNPISPVPIQLNEHFRSLPMLAEFTSDQFYKSDSSQQGLRIMTAVPEKKAINAFLDIEVKGKRDERSDINKEEVESALELIKSFASRQPTKLTKEVFEIPHLQGKSISVGVLSFMRKQVEYTRDEVIKKLSDKEQEKISLLIGTPEDFQGNERDVMILIPCLDETRTRSKGFMEDDRRFNVATSRAKYFTYFVHGKLPSNMILMQQMLAKMGQGKEDIQHNKQGFLPIGWTYKKSEFESEFEFMVADIIEDIIKNEFTNRLVIYNQVKTCGYRLDFVVFDKETKKALAIEVDGKHHYFSDGTTYTDDHLERANALKRASWTIKYLPYWEWFQDGWIDRDAAAANDLRDTIRSHFN